MIEEVLRVVSKTTGASMPEADLRRLRTGLGLRWVSNFNFFSLKGIDFGANDIDQQEVEQLVRFVSNQPTAAQHLTSNHLSSGCCSLCGLVERANGTLLCFHDRHGA